MDFSHFLVINVLIAMFALVEAFEKEKKESIEKDRKAEEELIQNDKNLTEQQKKVKIKKL
jgi:hypothetical protein